MRGLYQGKHFLGHSPVQDHWSPANSRPRQASHAYQASLRPLDNESDRTKPLSTKLKLWKACYDLPCRICGRSIQLVCHSFNISMPCSSRHQLQIQLQPKTTRHMEPW
jgi:hypothetical protein